jgi:hypothetical protein
MRIKLIVHPIVLNFHRVRQNGLGAQNHINHNMRARAVGSALPILGGCLCTTREMLSIPPAAIIPRNSRRVWALIANAMSPLKTTWAAPIKPLSRSRFINRRACRRGRGSYHRLINERIPFRVRPLGLSLARAGSLGGARASDLGSGLRSPQASLSRFDVLK